MSPVVIWPSVLGLGAFACGLYAYRGDLSAPRTSGPSRMLALAPVFIVADTLLFAGMMFAIARAVAAQPGPRNITAPHRGHPVLFGGRRR